MLADVMVVCPKCKDQRPITNLLTAQSNQNVIYKCLECEYEQTNIKTKKG
ncbi:hypothetical protein [Halalkalibacter alkaliphilus]|uniref:Uncharacterized protein n=1 Tax=Halalkalibacter alkaliphilus TaxID=2917993 RepID=A0A9X2CVQ2_9BACI|nr:hypothetical protein [Halalkalibacter alkaliphilus]MCL7749133.1 hypothetical protein [Halalkalibacter alkaliphilus]